MQIEYCSKCGVRIDGRDLEQARACRTVELVCEECRLKLSDGGHAARPSNRLVTPNHSRAMQRRTSSTRTAVHPARYQPPPRQSPGSLAILIGLLLAGALGFILFTLWHAPSQENAQAPSSGAEARDREDVAAQTYERLIRFEGVKPDDRFTRVQYLEEFLRKHDGTVASAKARILLQDLKASGPKPIYRVNCGGNAVEPFMSDAFCNEGETFSKVSDIVLTGVEKPAPKKVYSTERFGEFTYTFSNLTPGALYLVRLHFAELVASEANARLFTVRVNGTEMLQSFDIFAAAGGMDRAVVRDQSLPANDAGQIRIEFQRIKDNAHCSAIEIIELRPSLTPSPPPPQPASPAKPSEAAQSQTTSPAAQPNPASEREAMRITGLTLINVRTNKPVATHDPLKDGAVLPFGELGLTDINIRADVQGSVGSVAFDVDGTRFKIEDSAPYALAGDTRDKYLPWHIRRGPHTVRATPYSLPKAEGIAGAALQIRITIKP